MKSQLIELSKIKENPNNPRVVNDERFKKLVKSIKDFPKMLAIRPLVVDSNMCVLGGNMRLRACQKLSIKEVPVIFADNLTEEEQKEFIIKDNLGYGEWDFLRLQEGWDVPQLEDWGLEFPDLKEIGLEEDSEEEDFENSLPEIKTNILSGDLIEIGRHRLVCGDSTNPDIVEKLLKNEKPYLMVTDPPYGVNYDPAWRSKPLKRKEYAVLKVSNDHTSNWKDAYSLSPAKIAYVYHSALNSGQFFKDLFDCDYIIRSQIIWVKSHFVIGRSDYQPKHEPCWYAVKKNEKSEWISDRKQTTVWEIDKNSRNETKHSTQKPLECMLRPIRNHKGDVYDPFIGSGTTMVASEQLNRTCYGIELMPTYCQIIIDRMLKIKKDFIIKINGEKYVSPEN